MTKYIINGQQCWNVAHIARYYVEGLTGSGFPGVLIFPSISSTAPIGQEGVYVVSTFHASQAQDAFNAIKQFLADTDASILDLSGFQRSR